MRHSWKARRNPRKKARKIKYNKIKIIIKIKNKPVQNIRHSRNIK